MPLTSEHLNVRGEKGSRRHFKSFFRQDLREFFLLTFAVPAFPIYPVNPVNPVKLIFGIGFEFDFLCQTGSTGSTETSPILFRMPYPQNEEFPGSDFVANHVLPEYELPDFSWQIRHGAADLRVIDQFQNSSTQPL